MYTIVLHLAFSTEWYNFFAFEKKSKEIFPTRTNVDFYLCTTSRYCMWPNIICVYAPGAIETRYIFFLGNTCERDSLTLAVASSSGMTRRAVVAGLVSTKIHYNPLVHSKSVNSIPAGGKTSAEFDHLAALGKDASSWCSGATLFLCHHKSQCRSPSSGIATIVEVGVTRSELLTKTMERHTLALAQVTWVRAAAVLSLRGSNHTVPDSCKL